MCALFLHLSHGLQSFIQTLGLNNGPSQDKVSAVGKLVAIFFGLAYIAIPLAFLFHIVKI